MAKVEEAASTQLATRIPKDLHHRLKLYCVTHDMPLMQFVVEAIEFGRFSPTWGCPPRPGRLARRRATCSSGDLSRLPAGANPWRPGRGPPTASVPGAPAHPSGAQPRRPEASRAPRPPTMRCVVTEGRRGDRRRSERIPRLKALSFPTTDRCASLRSTRDAPRLCRQTNKAERGGH